MFCRLIFDSILVGFVWNQLIEGKLVTIRKIYWPIRNSYDSIIYKLSFKFKEYNLTIIDHLNISEYWRRHETILNLSKLSQRKC